MAGLTRGPLPAAVYWRRRLTLLVLVAVLAFAGYRLADVVGGEPQDPPTAELAAGESTSEPSSRPSSKPSSRPSARPSSEAPSVEPSDGTSSRPSAGPRPAQTQSPEGEPSDVPVMPDGPCAVEDVEITPQVPSPVAGQPVRIVLELQTKTDPACTFALSPASMTLKITSGSDLIWTSLHCKAPVPKRTVVVRSDEPTRVAMTWSSRRSDEHCSNRTKWALPGYYHVLAAALGGEPTQTRFRLR